MVDFIWAHSAVPLRYSVAVNSVSDLMVNKLDILSGLEELRIVTSYRVAGAEARWPGTTSSGTLLLTGLMLRR